MCGIAGAVDFEISTSLDELETTALAMAGAVRHRGPDHLGSWSDPGTGVSLGHSRLAIIDPSPDGNEPIASSDGRYLMVFNGEIYNHREMRRQLGSGVAFRGTCDAETLVEAIARWDLLKAIRAADGMFALAVYDRADRQLTLVRDRMGEKPLYYGWAGRHFLFGSELKALASHPAFRPELDRAALAEFLRFGYVPSPGSIYQGVFKLPPATSLVVAVDEVSARPTPEPYWSLLDVAVSGVSEPLALSAPEAVEHLDALLRETVASRMIADVPLGAFLSGGIDSSTVVAFMQSLSDRAVQTFSVGVAESGFDEARDAARVARMLGTNHTEVYITPREAWDLIPSLPTVYDEPFADSSQIPTLLVSSVAAKDVKVALSGDGGDEVFGGYVRHQFAAGPGRGLNKVPRPLRRAAGAILSSPSPRDWDRMLELGGRLLPAALRQARPGEKLHKLADVARAEDADEMYARLTSIWLEPEGLVIAGAGSAPETSRSPVWPDAGALVDRWMYADASTYLPDDILVKVDRASMSRGLEVRVPYLAPKVIEFAWRLPRELKIRDGVGKWPLRQVLQRYVPRDLVERPKQGFGIPVGEWLRGPLRGWAEDLLSEERLRNEEIFRAAPIRRAWSDHLARRRELDQEMWTLLMFQAWWGEHDRTTAVASAARG